MDDQLLRSLQSRIDIDRLRKFVDIALEANQDYLELMKNNMTTAEQIEQQLILSQGVFLQLILSNSKS